MSLTIRDLRTDWRDGDAVRLAEFMHRSSKGWPSGGWDPETPEEAERSVRERHLLGAFIAERDGVPVSYCSLSARPNDPYSGYVPFLTADPAIHGRGYGKAVLLAAIERAYELGYERVCLDTWPGNTKAVPLYKKAGFMWRPDSDWGVDMENFTPSARRHPIAAGYFAKHDWYATQKRDLSVVPDEFYRGRMRVYPYEWEAEGDRLRMVYDRKSWGLLEIETNGFLVGCTLDDERLIAGIPHAIRWQIVNYGSSPLDIVLVASADEGVRLAHTASFSVTDRRDLEVEFEIDPEIKPKESQPRCPVIRTRLLVNGTPLSLSAGFDVKQALSFGLDSTQSVRPGRPERVVVQCWSEVEAPVKANVRLTPSAGLSVDPVLATVELPARGAAEVPVTLCAQESGPAQIRAEGTLELDGRTITSRVGELFINALAPGDVAARVEDDHVVLESAALLVSISRWGASATIMDKLRNRREVASVPRPQLGPPFTWNEFEEKACAARVERHGERVTAILHLKSVFRPGVVVERRLTLSNLPLIGVVDAVVNGSAVPQRLTIRGLTRLQSDGGMVALPTRGGIIRTPGNSSGRGVWEHKPSERPEDWPEGWIAQEDAHGSVTGLLWSTADRLDVGGWNNTVDQRLPELAPGQSAAASPMYVLAGAGSTLTVQRWWQILHGDRQVREQRQPEERHPLRFGIEPSPLILHGQRTKAKLSVESAGTLELAGSLTLAMPEGLGAAPAATTFRAVSEQRPHARRITIAREGDAPEGGYFADANLRIDRALYHERQPVIVLGNPGQPVTVEPDGDLFRLGNGILTLTVAPAFQGSAISLRQGGQEMLRSAYPEPRAFSWSNPWYGGISPSPNGISAFDLAKEIFRPRRISRRGTQGISWRGLRLTCMPQHERARHVGLIVDYLLAPGSAIIAVVLHTVRRAGVSGQVGGWFEVYPSLAGGTSPVLLSGQADRRVNRIDCGQSGGVDGHGWTIARNPDTGWAALVAARYGDARTGAQCYGPDGYSLHAHRSAHQEAHEARESVFFVCFTAGERAESTAEALATLSELP